MELTPDAELLQQVNGVVECVAVGGRLAATAVYAICAADRGHGVVGPQL